MKRIKNKEVLVAFSGGVDSAVSVLELQRKKFLVKGVYFEMLDGQGKKSIQKMAKQLKMELEIIDLKKQFEKDILENFYTEYEKGRTPNPCILCNKQIKFKFLFDLADKMKIKYVATGHYVSVKRRKGIPYITKAKDSRKDQSYFLYRLNSRELERVVFPLSDLTKKRVKEIAKEVDLKIPLKESQDVCFMNNNEKLKEFLLNKIEVNEGDIVSDEGEIVGKHIGVSFYTIGQRRGLNVNGGPFYVFDKNVKKNIVFITKNKKHEKLEPTKVLIKDVNWSNISPEEGKEYTVKTRYLATESKAFIERFNEESYLVIFKEPQWAVAPGQSLVLFDRGFVIGGGVISGSI